MKLLDEVTALMQQGEVDKALSQLKPGLYETRQKMSPEEWRKFCVRCRAHPVVSLLTQDPFTRRAFEKPRGYPGDAVLMDIMYRHQSVSSLIEDATPLGKAIYNVTINAPITKAVRHRLKFVENLVERVCKAKETVAILSIACGHAREIENVSADLRHRISRFTIVDHDKETINKVVETHPLIPVQPYAVSARVLFTGQFQETGFDLVYSVGLIDYMEDAIAMRLAQSMYQRLNPGGFLLLPNLLPSIDEIGYMEAFMDWKLVYRSEADMKKLAKSLPESAITVELSKDSEEDIVYLLIQKPDVA